MWHIFDFLIDFLGRFFMPRSWRLYDRDFFTNGANDLRWIVYIALIAILISSKAMGFLIFLLAIILADLVLEFIPEIRDTYWYKFTQGIYVTLAILGLIFMILYIVASLKTEVGGIVE
jgi:hypothetical protein